MTILGNIEVYTSEEMAEILGITLGTLRTWEWERKKGTRAHMPESIKHNGHRYYKQDELEPYYKAQRKLLEV